jgi:biopolymer transport protein TolR
MAMTINENENEDTNISDINITPFVDVVLVLLVIFMITAPALMKDIIDLKLPKTETSDGKIMQTLGVAINRDGNILLNGQITDEAGLMAATKESLAVNPQTQAIISADVEVVYGRVVKVIDLLKSVGLDKFAVQIEKQN